MKSARTNSIALCQGHSHARCHAACMRGTTQTVTSVPDVRAQEFLAEEGVMREDGAREDPSLPAFEAEVARYRIIQVQPQCSHD